MARFISRDPFAREEIHRESVETHEGCSWCGGKRKDGKLYRYYIERDSIRYNRSDIDGLFCGICCMRAYSGL